MRCLSPDWHILGLLHDRHKNLGDRSPIVFLKSVIKSWENSPVHCHSIRYLSAFNQ